MSDRIAQEYARQPCLHRLLADCSPDPDGILQFAGRYGLLTVTVSRVAEPGRVVQADALPPEPLDIWRREIRALQACTDLWDAIAGGNRDATDLLNRKLAEKLAGVRFQLTAWPEGGRFRLGYRPARLIDALWQRFAEEIAGIIQCARCPAPNCGRWFLRSAARSDRLYCSQACRMRAWRGAGT
jgi:predicted RNA-binding Zn ribbon-like protein